jgi:imidazolonepropionase-like amidohydrolase
VLDFPGATLLPGLVDCHTHTNMPGDGRTGEQVDLEDDDIRLLRSARNVRIALCSGVTTLADCGAWNHTAFSLRRGINLGLVDGPRVLVAGRPVTSTGGHLWYMGGEADGVEGVRHQARRLIKEGADFIKVVASGGSTVTSDPYRPSLSVEEISAACQEAHNRGKPVAAHCRSTVAINNALGAGVDLVLHCAFYDPNGSYRFDQATAERLAHSGVWVNPTLHIGRPRLAVLRQKRDHDHLTAEEEALLKRMEQGERERMEQFGRLSEMGVKLVGGSDCGWGTYKFGDFQGELLALVDTGLSPMAAILAGTRHAAAALGVLGSAGTIEPGKDADLLLVDGNPAEEIAALRRVVAVFRGGRRAVGCA